MNQTNGTTQNASGRCKNGQCKDEREGLGEYGENSPVHGIDSLRTFTANSSRENNPWLGDYQRDTNTGKIFERLELIEQRFLTYVQGHQQQLETRLEESKTAEIDFKEELQALKQEIYLLTAKPQG